MNKMLKVATNARGVIMRNSPTILTGLGVAGLASTVVMAVRVTPKAMEIIKEAEQQLFIKAVANQDDDYVPGTTLTKKEVILLTWKCYLPVIAMGSLTIACIIGANSINLRRNAALASVYSLSEAALKEYQNKVVETIGEAKAKEIKDKISEDKVKNTPVHEEYLIYTGKGDTLCFDSLSGRYFKSDINTIKQEINELARTMINQDTVTLNEVYYAFDLPPTELGEMLIFHIDDGKLEGDFSSQLTNRGEPCLVVSFNTSPRYEY